MSVVSHARAHQAAPLDGSRRPEHLETYANAIADRLAGQRPATIALGPLVQSMAATDAADFRTVAVGLARRLAAWPPLEGSHAL